MAELLLLFLATLFVSTGRFVIKFKVVIPILRGIQEPKDASKSCQSLIHDWKGEAACTDRE